MSLTNVLAAILITVLADNLVTLHMFGAGNMSVGVSDLTTAVSIGGVVGSCSAAAADPLGRWTPGSSPRWASDSSGCCACLSPPCSHGWRPP